MVATFPKHIYHSPLEVRIQFECPCSYKTKILVSEGRKVPTYLECRFCSKKYHMFTNLDTPKGHLTIETLDEENEKTMKKVIKSDPESFMVI